MRIVSLLATGALAAAAILTAGSAQAATVVGDGTLSTVGLFVPTVTLGATSGSFAANGSSFITAGTGSFSGLFGPVATTNGTINFSNTTNGAMDEVLNNFLTFTGNGGTYSFSVASVKTISYAASAASNSVSLYLLGSTMSTDLGLGATPTSLTLSFNNTAGSPYASSATLAIPPSGTGAVPETATWGMLVMGFGAMGAAMRRKRASVTFA